MKTSSIIVASLVLWAGIASSQDSVVTVTVNGSAGPWSWVNGGLNTDYQYATGDFGFNAPLTPPTVVGATVGNSLTIKYLSGSVAFQLGGPGFDANGDTSVPLNNQIANGYGPQPSCYMNPSTFPIFVAELVGTFANNNGQIVGTPFAIGDLGTFTVPTGATQLQLGANDNDYGDNSGSWNIQITTIAIPEPTTITLVLMSLVGFGFAVRRGRGRRRI